MKIFISWSGDAAEDFALFLRGWLRHVVQALKPFMSEQDIGKGSRNVVEMSKELAATEFGIVVVTRDNLGAPWINFEAGVISRSIENGRLVPLLLDVSKADVVGPLSQFQAVYADDPVDVHRLFQEINRCLAEPLEPDVLVSSVQTNLPALGEAIGRYRAAAGTPERRVQRTPQDMFEEVLLMLREMQPVRRALPGPPDPDVSTLSEVAAEELRRLDTSLASGQIEPRLYLRLRNILLDKGRGDEGSET